MYEPGLFLDFKIKNFTAWGLSLLLDTKWQVCPMKFSQVSLHFNFF